MINVISVLVGLVIVVAYIAVEDIQPNVGIGMVGVVLIICGLL